MRCAVEDCDMAARERGWCHKHYRRWTRHGDPLGGGRKHGGKGTRLYDIWNGMKSRCIQQNHIDFRWYGGRGITVCDEWLDFIPFRDWALANGYADPPPGTPRAQRLSIDRINHDGNYEPANCRWIPLSENASRRAL